MNNTIEPVAQLVTRIPTSLRRQLKVYCVENDTTVAAFVIDAITERLTREQPSRNRRAAAR